ncbi:MAG: hypothetical protein GF384_01300 [Elusimicrobia bacterium]|nr:hypothetical protein [Elusimicrobiota bacterium]
MLHPSIGRIQEPLIQYLRKHYKVNYVDVITEPGPCKILSEKTDKTLVNIIVKRIDVSIQKHKSKLIAILGHFDCAGNPATKIMQKSQVKKSMAYLKRIYSKIKIIGLWVDKNWNIHTIV